MNSSSKSGRHSLRETISYRWNRWWHDLPSPHRSWRDQECVNVFIRKTLTAGIFRWDCSAGHRNWLIEVNRLKDGDIVCLAYVQELSELSELLHDCQTDIRLSEADVDFDQPE